MNDRQQILTGQRAAAIIVHTIDHAHHSTHVVDEMLDQLPQFSEAIEPVDLAEMLGPIISAAVADGTITALVTRLACQLGDLVDEPGQHRAEFARTALLYAADAAQDKDTDG